LIPGIHVNTIYILIPTFSVFFATYNIPNYAIAAFIIASSITSTIVDFIPSIFLGAPEESTALSILPGHKLLLQGKGFEALFLTICGGVFVTILFTFLLPLLLVLLSFIYNTIRFYIAYILLSLSIFMIITERDKCKIFFSTIVFLLSGFLGIITFRSGILDANFVFFPLFTGLFAVPTLILSLKNKSCIPPQEELILKIDRRLIFSGVLKSMFSSLLIGLLPGVGAAQATVLAQEITKRRDPREFLVSIGGVNTVVSLVSFVALYSIKRARSGAAVAVNSLLENFGINEILLLISVSLISVGISAILTIHLGNKILKIIKKFPYSKISLAVLFFLLLLCFIFTGFVGFFVLCIGAFIGLIAPLSKIKRSHCMGVLIVPVILFYLKLTSF